MKVVEKFRSGFGQYGRVLTEFEGESLTKQCFKDDCDINNIVLKHARGEGIENVNPFQGQYADCCDLVDYRHGLDAVIQAQAMFDALPAKVRDRFNNDPAQMLEFTSNSENWEEMVKLGLATAEPVQKSNPEGAAQPST